MTEMKNALIILMSMLLSISLTAQSKYPGNQNVQKLYNYYEKDFENNIVNIVREKLKDDENSSETEEYKLKMETELNAQADALYFIKEMIQQIYLNNDSKKLTVFSNLLKEMGTVNDYYKNEDELSEEEFTERLEVEQLYNSSLNDLYIDDHLNRTKEVYFWPQISTEYHVEALIKIKCDWAKFLSRYYKELKQYQKQN